MDDLNVLRIFVAAAEAGSFSAASTVLGLTRSAVAKAIARLEQRTATRLFHRTTRIITLTEEGKALLARCAVNLSDLQNALDELASAQHEPRGLLRITVPDAYGRSRVMPVLERYLKAWPKVDVDANFSDRAVDLVTEGFDLALRIGAGNVRDDIVSRVVARHRLSLCASPEYLASHGTPRTLNALKDHICMQFGKREQALSWRLNDLDGHAVRLEKQVRIRFDSGEALRDAAAAGLGITQLPDFLIDPHIAAGKLRRILENHEPELVPIVALYPSRKHLAPKVRSFIDCFVEAQEHPVA